MRDELEALLKNYKLHNKDIDACFNDAVAVTHLITSIINLVDKEIPKKKANALKPGGIVLSEDGKTVAISNLTSASSGGYNQAIDDMRAIIRSKE